MSERYSTVDTDSIRASVQRARMAHENLIESNRELVEGLKEAKIMIQEWAGYASDYLKEKHNLTGDLAEIQALIDKHSSS